MLGLIGFFMIITVIGLLLSEKAHTVVVFCIVPVLFGLIGGFSLKEVGDFITAGIQMTSSTAILCIFAILYFSIMSDQGMFDGIVKGLSKMADKNIILVFIATALIACFSHLDGASASTLLVTIPAMMPVFKKLKIRPVSMLLIISCSIGAMNLMPWSGGIVRVASALQLEAGDLWHRLIPIQIATFVIILAVCAVLGIFEKKYIETHPEESCGVSGGDQAAYTDRQLRLRPFNLLLTGILIAALLFQWTNLNMAFFIALAGALLINYKGVKEQQNAIRKFSGHALPVAAIMISAGVFVGILSKSGMLTEMVQFLAGIVPEAVGPYLHIIVAVLSTPLFMVMGADSFFFALLPLLAGVGESFGVSSMNMACAMLIGGNLCLLVSPLAPTTYLAMDMVGTTLKENLKTNLPKVYIITLITVFAAAVLGVLSF